MLDLFLSKYKEKKDHVDNWLSSLTSDLDLPIYTSVDIRDCGFKASSVDTNLFPAGFNNLCMVSINNAIKMFKTAISKKHNSCRHILLICEEHTRNTWYLENIYTLEQIAKQAGFKLTIATFMSSASLQQLTDDTLTLKTALNHEINVHRLRPIINDIKLKKSDIDLIILNNDLSDGIPDELLESDLSIFPSPTLGWHNRKKTTHFKHFNQIANDLMNFLGCDSTFDSWILSTLYEEANQIDINNPDDRAVLFEKAQKLFSDIKDYYLKYSISKEPFIFLKANSGTYGMGVLPIHSPKDILELNRKSRNKLFKGKSSIPITNYILQEGVYSNLMVSNQSAEMVVYSIHNNPVGSFFRVNSKKGEMDNLNSTGMFFERVCVNPEHNQSSNFLYDSSTCGTAISNDQLLLYELISKIAGVAATFEKKEHQ